MAEEESGFTFVDKRRVQDAEEPPAAEQPMPDVAPDAPEEEAPEAEGSPDIYGVLGYCVSLLATEAWHKLGLLADPQTGETTMDLDQAKVAIDAVGDLTARLEAAPGEAVPATLRRDLRTLLNDLRLNYVARRGDPAVSRN
ncbi:MAG: DUF1844 domain-containing protein [Armatimonadetes bacterium]|nr:DUF1844 domain-containing protein [Armatimonadota bacterium]